MSQPTFRNVLGEDLEPCGTDPPTGFFRNGSCQTDVRDLGNHSVCAEVTEEFLEYSAARGNELRTPIPEHGFPGLEAGDRWCVCAARWQEALEAGVAPPVRLASTEENALEVVLFEDLKRYAIDG